MNERIRKLAIKSGIDIRGHLTGDLILDEKPSVSDLEKFAELIMQDMHKKVIASILITDVVAEEKGLIPTAEDYILAINKDFGVEE